MPSVILTPEPQARINPRMARGVLVSDLLGPDDGPHVEFQDSKYPYWNPERGDFIRTPAEEGDWSDWLKKAIERGQS